MPRNVTFAVQITHFCIRPNERRERKKKGFAFFLATFEQLLTFLGATLEQVFEKFRATFWEISSNLWQALDKAASNSR